jgi:uncharacterized heparinase superfamily protein
MIEWLDVMSHPDGGIAFFNDAALGVAPTLGQLRGLASRLGLTSVPERAVGLRQLPASGYLSVDSPPFHLLCDVAPIGPDHLPAHAHADTLSFELSYAGRRLIVNSGTSQYGADAERQRQRGTAAHNTIVIDAQDSSEVWSAFRVARRARARLLEAHGDRRAVVISGEHDGYLRLGRRNTHRRTWRLENGELSIEDEVPGRVRSAVAYFHLHPEISARRVADGVLRLSDGGRALVDIRFEGAGRIEVAESTWHPQFGRTLPNLRIAASLSGPRLITRIRRSEAA